MYVTCTGNLMLNSRGSREAPGSQQALLTFRIVSKQVEVIMPSQRRPLHYASYAAA